jgi:hypothetical protein
MSSVLNRRDDAPAEHRAETPRPFRVDSHLFNGPRRGRQRAERLALDVSESLDARAEDAPASDPFDRLRETDEFEIVQPSIGRTAMRTRQHFHDAIDATDERSDRVRAAPVSVVEIDAAFLVASIATDDRQSSRLRVGGLMQTTRLEVRQHNRTARLRAETATGDGREHPIDLVNRGEMTTIARGQFHDSTTPVQRRRD